jgi:hypothetical protein
LAAARGKGITQHQTTTKVSGHAEAVVLVFQIQQLKAFCLMQLVLVKRAETVLAVLLLAQAVAAELPRQVLTV